MKSSYGTLCFLALFVCFTRGTSENLDNDRIYLDRRTITDDLDIENLIFHDNPEDVQDTKSCDDSIEDKKCQNGGICTEKDSAKTCSCKPGASGDFCQTIAKCNEKDCGNEATCVLVENENVICQCKQNKLLFDENDKKCKESCDDSIEDKKCQNGGICTEKDSAKTCSCKPGASGDFCQTIAKCNEKDCGNEATCVLVENENVICQCKQNKLLFDENDKKCKESCDDSIEAKKCQNGGICTGEDSAKTCSCKPGASGDFCQTIAKCNEKDCGNEATCVLVENENVICQCKQNKLLFDENDKKCKESCDDSIEAKKCQNGGICTGEDSAKTCSCKPGASGDFCQTIAKCNEKDCGNEATCVLVENENVICQCKQNKLLFDENDKKCKESCDDSIEAKKCQNGGICTGEDSAKTCSCKPGASGDFCQTIAKCNEKDCGNEATCVLVENENVICQCKQNKLLFDENDKKCKDTCDDSIEAKKCQNGGSCTGTDSLKFCSCKAETSGDFCQTIAKCNGNDCGKDATCVLDDSGNVMCKCKQTDLTFDKSDKKCKMDYCKKKCNTKGVACDESKRFDKNVECTCDEVEQSFDSGKCKDDYCKKNCGSYKDVDESVFVIHESVKCEPTKKFDSSVQCQCKSSKAKFDKTVKQCKIPCKNNADCMNDGECKKEEKNEHSFCVCKTGTSGDKCNIVEDCQPGGKWAKCTGGSKGKCSFDVTENVAQCKCNTDKKNPSEKMQFCVDICTDNTTCKGNRFCDKNLCECKPGYGGDECNKVTGCDEKKIKECTAAKAKCVHDEKHPHATCECQERGYTFKGSKCIHKFCLEPNQCPGAECEFNDAAKAGYCKCSNGDYYDYKAKECRKPDACLLTKCEENEVCEDGVCKCQKEDPENKKCLKKDDCDPACFEGATCSKGICVCGEGKIYVNNECQSESCISKDFKIKCECPDKFAREKENKPCKLEDSEYKSCSKNCGFGLCYKEGNDEFCECFKDKYVEEDKNGKCVLKVDACESQTLSEDSMKCKCTGIYKQAKNGITCELVTCEDEILSKLCQSYNAPCKMRWKDIPEKWTLENYCECPTGYVQEKSRKKCIDICSTENVMLECMKKDQLCYHSVSDGNEEKAKEHVTDCRCLPPIMEDEKGKCAGLSDNVYMVKNIPIMKAKYVRNAKVDSVLLNMDIIDSLKQTYSADMFDYGYLHDFKEEGDVLKCNVWIVFKKDASDVKERIRLQSQKFTNESCGADQKCNLNATIWPPSILMSENLVKDVAVESLTFCSFAKDLLCGENTECQDKKKCVCKPGFQAPTMAMRVFGDVVVQRCEDIDECATKTHDCPDNTQCENTFGSYRCVCKPGFKKEVESTDKNDQGKCIELCSTSPCGKGSCSVVNNTVDCKCEFGYAGSFCNRKDVNLASAKKQVVVVGAVLGTILGVALIGFILFYRKVRKSSHSQDFTPAPRRDNAEMMERRPMRGVVNKSYE